MTITLTQAQSFVSKVAGGSPELTTVAAMVNMAGHHLAAMHPWSWLIRPPAGISLVASQEWAALPSDFGEVISVVTSDLTGFAWVGYDEILALRYQQDAIASGYVAAIVYNPPGGSSAPDAARMEIYPTPAASKTNALRIAYRAGWSEITTTSDALKIPGWVDLLFYEILRAVVLGLEEHDGGGVAERLAAVQGGSVFLTAAKRDARVQEEGGMLRGGVGQARRRFDEIGDVAFPA